MAEISAAKLESAGAGHFIDSAADLPAVLDRIETEIAPGEPPQC